MLHSEGNESVNNKASFGVLFLLGTVLAVTNRSAAGPDFTQGGTIPRAA